MRGIISAWTVAISEKKQILPLPLHCTQGQGQDDSFCYFGSLFCYFGSLRRPSIDFVVGKETAGPSTPLRFGRDDNFREGVLRNQFRWWVTGHHFCWTDA
jgi:hypothetical protein